MTALYWAVGMVCLLLLLGLFLLLPGRRRDRTPFFTVPYAHRGLHGNGLTGNSAPGNSVPKKSAPGSSLPEKSESGNNVPGSSAPENSAPENSLPAFRAAVEAGVGIELDVQLSRDGVPMVFHDGTLARVCGANAPGGIVDYTREELLRFSLAGTAEKIPTLREVLDLVDGRVPLLLEIKNDGDGPHTAEVVQQLLDAYNGPYCVESFSPLILRYYKKKRPSVIRGQLAADFWHDPQYRKHLYCLIGLLFFNFLARPDFIAYRKSGGHIFPLRFCRFFGSATAAWTILSPAEAEKARSDGFDTIIFEGFLPEQGGEKR